MLHVTNHVSGLTAGETVYFSWRLTNCATEIWSDAPRSVSTLAPPVVDNGSGASVSLDQATLNGNLIVGSLADIVVYFGRRDGGTNPLAWEQSFSLGSRPNGPFSAVADGLYAGVPYYYRTFATNSLGSDWAPNTEVFKVRGPADSLKMTFCGYDRTTVLENFPVLLKLDTSIPGFSYERFLSANGYDLRFWSSNLAIELNYEIDEWDPNGTSTVWVQIPALVNSNTCIWATWGDPGDAAQPAYTTNGATWGHGFEGVWHLGETVFDEMVTTGVHRDATANGFHANQDGNAAITGVVGQGQQFDGINDRIQRAYESALNPSNFTVSLWARSDGGEGTYRSPLTSRHDVNGQQQGYNLYAGNDNMWQSWTADAGFGVQRAGSVVPGEWVHLTASYAAGIKTFYRDGVRTAQGAQIYSPMTNGNPLNIGSGGALGTVFYYNGLIDEVQVSSVARSADWVWAAYRNTATGQTFACYTSGGLPTAHLAIRNEPATDISPTTAVVRAELGGERSVADVTVFWNTIDGGTNASLWTNSVAIGLFTNMVSFNLSQALSGLQPETTYYFTWRATNCDEEVWAEPAASFTTFALAPAVNNGAGALVGQGNARLHASLVDGAASELTLYWGTRDGMMNASDWDHSINLGTVNLGDYSTVLNGLVSGLSYYYRAYVSNSYGVAWASNSVSFKSPGQAPEVKITLCGYDRASTLQNLPMLVQLGTNIPGFDYREFFSPAGHDLRFWNSNKTVALSYDIEKWDTSGVSYVWVEVPE
ncbi:MAG: DUF2341 domain-containing protein, partial [Verrucomicrobiota bacterium]